MKKYIPSLLISFMLLFLSLNILAQTDSSSSVQTKYYTVVFTKCFAFTDKENWDSAVYYAKILQELVIRASGEYSDRNGQALYLIAEIYRSANNYNLAYFFFKRSISVFEKIAPKITSWQTYGFALSRMGFTCTQMGAIGEAKKYFTKALQINKIAKNPDYIQIMMFFANILSTQGEYTKSEALYTSLNETLDTLPQNGFTHYLQASICNDLASVYSQIGNNAKSLAYLKKGYAIVKISKEEDFDVGQDLDQIALNLAEMYALMNKPDSASLICRNVEDEQGFKSGLLCAELLKVKGTICQQQNNLLQAIDLDIQYKKVSDSLTVKPDNYEDNMVNLALLYIDTKQNAKADCLLRNQIASLWHAGLNYSYVMQHSIEAMCANLIDLKKYDEATDSLISLASLTFTAMKENFPGMSETEKLKYETDIDRIFDLLYISIFNKNNISRNELSVIYKLELERKAMILNSQINLLNKVRSSHDTSLISIYNNWVSYRQILSKQYSLPYQQRFMNVDSLENKSEVLEKELSGNQTSPITPLPNSYKKLEHNNIISSHANIEFIRFNYKVDNTTPDSAFYEALVLTLPDSVLTIVHLCSEKQLTTLMKNKKGEWINENQLTQNLYSKNKSGSQFYKMIWQPLERYLKGVKIINYSTSGLLNNIAFDAIYNGKNYLIDNYVFRRFFNLKNTENSFTTYKNPHSINIWGNINYDSASYSGDDHLNKAIDYDSTFSATPNNLNSTSSLHLKNLSKERLQPFKTNEVVELNKIFSSAGIKVTITERKKATEENFKNEASNMQGVLHISTHGFYTRLDTSKTRASSPNDFISGTQNPLLRCGLALSGVNYYWLKGYPRSGHDDGILTGYEISQLDLSKVQLVTLSACETGLGDVTSNEGDLGLQRAFKLAGAKNILMSLWQVPVKQTSELLSLFYKNWLKGQTLSISLKNAQLFMAKKYIPYFWAAFVLIE